MRYLNLILIGLSFLVYFIVFSQTGIAPVILFFPFTMAPFIVTAYLAFRWRSFWSQAVLLATNVAYAAWFIYVYVSATILHPDPQSPIAFFFVGVYAAPVLAILWWISYAIEWEREVD